MALNRAPGDFSDADNTAFVALLRQLTPQQMLVLLVYLQLRSQPDRQAIVQRLTS